MVFFAKCKIVRTCKIAFHTLFFYFYRVLFGTLAALLASARTRTKNERRPFGHAIHSKIRRSGASWSEEKKRFLFTTAGGALHTAKRSRTSAGRLSLFRRVPERSASRKHLGHRADAVLAAQCRGAPGPTREVGLQQRGDAAVGQ